MLLAAKEEYAKEGLPPAALDFDGLDNVKVSVRARVKARVRVRVRVRVGVGVGVRVRSS